MAAQQNPSSSITRIISLRVAFYYHLISLSDHRNNQRSHKQFVFIDCIHRSDSESPPLGLTSAAIFIAYFHMKFIHTIKKSRWTLFLPSCWILTSLNYISHLILIPENEKFHTFLASFQTPLPYHVFNSLDSFIRELELKFSATSLLRFKLSEMYFIFYLRSWIWEISHLFGLFPNAVTLSFLHSIYWIIFRNQSSSSQLLFGQFQAVWKIFSIEFQSVKMRNFTPFRFVFGQLFGALFLSYLFIKSTKKQRKALKLKLKTWTTSPASFVQFGEHLIFNLNS